MSTTQMQKLAASEIIRSSWIQLTDPTEEIRKIQNFLKLGNLQNGSRNFNSTKPLKVIQGLLQKKEEHVQENLTITPLRSRELQYDTLPPNQLQDPDLLEQFESIMPKKQGKSDSESEPEEEAMEKTKSKKGTTKEEAKKEVTKKDSKKEKSKEVSHLHNFSVLTDLQKESKKEASETEEPDTEQEKKKKKKEKEKKKKDDKKKKDKKKKKGKKSSKSDSSSSESDSDSSSSSSSSEEDAKVAKKKKEKEEKKKESKKKESEKKEQKASVDDDSKKKDKKKKKEEESSEEESEGGADTGKKERIYSAFNVIQKTKDISSRVENYAKIIKKYSLDEEESTELLENCMVVMKRPGFKKNYLTYLTNWTANFENDNGTKFFSSCNWTTDTLKDMKRKKLGNLMIDIIMQCSKTISKANSGVLTSPKRKMPEPASKKDKKEEESESDGESKKKQKKEEKSTPKKQQAKVTIKASEDTEPSAEEKKKLEQELQENWKFYATHLFICTIEPKWEAKLEAYMTDESIDQKEKEDRKKAGKAFSMASSFMDQKEAISMILAEQVKENAEKDKCYKSLMTFWRDIATEIDSFEVEKCETDIECFVTGKKTKPGEDFKITIDMKEGTQVIRNVSAKWKDLVHIFYIIMLQERMIISYVTHVFGEKYVGKDKTDFKAISSFLLNDDEDMTPLFKSFKAAYNVAFNELNEARMKLAKNGAVMLRNKAEPVKFHGGWFN